MFELSLQACEFVEVLGTDRSYELPRKYGFSCIEPWPSYLSVCGRMMGREWGSKANNSRKVYNV